MPLLFLFVLALLSLGSPVAHSAEPPSPSPTYVTIDDFEAGLSAKWEVKNFKGQTAYEVIDDAGAKVLKARTAGSASGLIQKLDLDIEEFPFVTWRWKVEGVIEGGDATVKSGDDYPARVYIVFPGWIPLFAHSINYIWANKLPKDEHIPSTFNPRFIMVALQSGNTKAGEWVTERRNVVEDYKKLFGKAPPKVGAIAIMTDADQTGGSATAYYDDLRFESVMSDRVPLDTGAAKR